ncbi:MAG: YihY/virulence factor BrkB family protein [Erythrobacter sp.]
MAVKIPFAHWLEGTVLAPGTRAFAVARQTISSTFRDGFMHAGNLAYLAMLAIFPFFILGAALFELIGGRENAELIVTAMVDGLPPAVADEIRPAAISAIYARKGWVLWLGAVIALWTVSSLVETIRDILRRAYGASRSHAFWRYRLGSVGLIMLAVVVLILSLFTQVVIGTAQQVIQSAFPQLGELLITLRLSRVVPAMLLAASLWVLFFSLTPEPYRKQDCPKWPGALATSIWWVAVATALPVVLRYFLTFDLTYGSLAGIMVSLFFFWLIGLGLVIGAELNAALANISKPADEPTTEVAE